MLFYYFISPYVLNLHRRLVLRISGNMLHKTRPSVKYPLYLKKAGLASRVSVSAVIFFILFV